MMLPRKIIAGRYAPLWMAMALYVAVSSATRLALWIKALTEDQVGAASILAILPLGALYDLVECLYLFAPFALYLLLLPDRAYRSRAQRRMLHGVFALSFFGLLYLAAVEYFFFDEFNARFNFVAVEYLIYPHEVFVNIWQSYPVGRTLLAAAVVAAALAWSARGALAASLAAETTLGSRFRPWAGMTGALLIAHGGVDITTSHFSDNRVANELAVNGIYAFFNAALNADLDYRQYYRTLPPEEARERVRRMVAQPNARFIDGAANPLARHVEYEGAPNRLHVIVLLEESLGADFVGAYGDARGLTPNLDRIAGESLVFTRTYATGTRTVRGMEGVTASFPPVPAESIVKRPHNEGMFNWSTVMRAAGYSPTFIYGGYGTFDNMNYFFGHNGYRVVDRTDMDAPHFSNIWGVSDEDLFRNALRVFDEQVARGERIFSVVMTTSNHKPFTFPEGVAGVPPQGGGREAGVRYADHAIGKFFEEFRKRPWHDDALVVIVGDHGARVYGREDFPMRSYELPLMIHAPKHVPARRVDVLTSQIDVAPTVLGLLHLSHDSAFFGRDVLGFPSAERFVLLNHNRDVALYTDQQLTELNFRKGASAWHYDRASGRQDRVPMSDERLRDAEAVFQTAYDLYRQGLYRWN